MKRILLTLVLAYLASMAHAQMFWIEKWDSCHCDSLCTSYTGPKGAWNINPIGYNGPAANLWYFSYREQGLGRGACGSAVGTLASAHIGNVSGSPAAMLICPNGDCGALNDDSPGTTWTNTRLESPIINCSGRTSIKLSYNHMEKGDPVSDFATLWYYDGTSWSQLKKMAQTAPICPNSQGLWTYDTISLPSSANNNANVRIGFLWFNDTSATAVLNLDYPSFAVDSIMLRGTVLAGVNGSNAAKGNITVYPNPNEGKFIVRRSCVGAANLEVLNVLGQEVCQKTLLADGEEVNLSGQPAGLYFYRVVDQSGKLLGQGKIEITR